MGQEILPWRHLKLLDNQPHMDAWLSWGGAYVFSALLFVASESTFTGG